MKRQRTFHLGRLWWGWGTTPAAHRWVRIEWRSPTKNPWQPYRTRFWEMQWR